MHSSRKANSSEMTVSKLFPIKLKLRIWLYIRLIAKQERKKEQRLESKIRIKPTNQCIKRTISKHIHQTATAGRHVAIIDKQLPTMK